MKKRLVVARNIEAGSILFGNELVSDVTDCNENILKIMQEKYTFLTEIVDVEFPELSFPGLDERVEQINTQIHELSRQIGELEAEKKKLC